MKEVVGKVFKKYKNPYRKKIRRSPLHWAAFLFGLYGKGDLPEVPENFTYPSRPNSSPRSDHTVTWVNHSTFLVSFGDFHLLTDPIWSDRCSPLPFLGPKRQHPPGISPESLPPLNLVLISHNHYDHLDRKTVLALHRKNPDILWMVPKGVKRWFEKRGINRVVEFEWWQKTTLENQNVTVTFVPAQHHSGRSLHDANKTLWGGFVIEFLNPRRTVYFAGDSGYNPVHFREIGEKFSAMDLSLLPIGVYTPDRFMQPVHISPFEAVNIHRDVRSKMSIGGHFKTFRLSEEREEQVLFDLYRAMEEAELDHNTFFVLQPGEKTAW